MIQQPSMIMPALLWQQGWTLKGKEIETIATTHDVCEVINIWRFRARCDARIRRWAARDHPPEIAENEATARYESQNAVSALVPHV